MIYINFDFKKNYQGFIGTDLLHKLIAIVDSKEECFITPFILILIKYLMDHLNYTE